MADLLALTGDKIDPQPGVEHLGERPVSADFSQIELDARSGRGFSQPAQQPRAGRRRQPRCSRRGSPAQLEKQIWSEGPRVRPADIACISPEPSRQVRGRSAVAPCRALSEGAIPATRDRVEERASAQEVGSRCRVRLEDLGSTAWCNARPEPALAGRSSVKAAQACEASGREDDERTHAAPDKLHRASEVQSIQHSTFAGTRKVRRPRRLTLSMGRARHRKAPRAREGARGA